MKQKTTARCVRGPGGEPLTLDDLPAMGQRWTVRRKAVVIHAVIGGLLSMQEACERYDLTVEEFLIWQRNIEDHGLKGLRTTRSQEQRRESALIG